MEVNIKAKAREKELLCSITQFDGNSSLYFLTNGYNRSTTKINWQFNFDTIANLIVGYEILLNQEKYKVKILEQLINEVE